MIVVGLSHRSAPVHIREQLALSEVAKGEFLTTLVSAEVIEQAFIVSTCNRVEVYALPRPGCGRRAAAVIRERLVSKGGNQINPHLYDASDEQAVRHLWRVAASLDSLVVGEAQILGQLKRAVQFARAAGTVGAELQAEANAAFQVAKRVRNETSIGAGQASIPTAAARLARQIFGELRTREVLLIGAGEMAQAAAKVLVHAGANPVIVNRSEAKALQLQRHVGGRTASWDMLERELVETDIVLSSTACPAIVLDRATLARVARARRGRSLFLIDIAVPRDIDPDINGLDGMYVYDIDDLSEIVKGARTVREQSAKKAEDIIEEELGSLSTRRNVQDMTPVIRQLRERTQRVLEMELERSLHGKLRSLSADERAALQTMIQSATKKLMHEPTVRLKALAEDANGRAQAECICAIFGLSPLDGEDNGAEGERTAAPACGMEGDNARRGKQCAGGSPPAWLSLAIECAR